MFEKVYSFSKLTRDKIRIILITGRQHIPTHWLNNLFWKFVLSKYLRTIGKPIRQRNMYNICGRYPDISSNEVGFAVGKQEIDKFTKA